MNKLLADAQKRLDDKLAADAKRKALQTAVTVAAEKSEQAEKTFKASVEEAKIMDPDLKAKEIPGVKAFTDKLTIEITSPERAVDIVIEKLRGIKGLLTINTGSLNSYLKRVCWRLLVGLSLNRRTRFRWTKTGESIIEALPEPTRSRHCLVSIKQESRISCATFDYGS